VDEAGATWSEQAYAHPLAAEGGAEGASPTGCPVHAPGLQSERAVPVAPCAWTRMTVSIGGGSAA